MIGEFLLLPLFCFLNIGIFCDWGLLGLVYLCENYNSIPNSSEEEDFFENWRDLIENIKIFILGLIFKHLDPFSQENQHQLHQRRSKPFDVRG